MTDRRPIVLKKPLSFSHDIPLALYIHFPWCVKKCPYCDFNSHALPDKIPEAEYIAALIRDCEQSVPLIWGRRIHSIFMGGGTPSLFSGASITQLLSQLRALLPIGPDTEITLEANPGTVDVENFSGYFDAGINRLSIGAQSFQEKHLKKLGRIHNPDAIFKTIRTAKEIGFQRINCDLMFGLPEQTLAEALDDLQQALSLDIEHLSWYQLTLEPNTYFFQHPPTLPEHDAVADIQDQGQALLAQHHYRQYEVSAYTRKRPCQHNVNYWQFGDYLGLGAGAHSKISHYPTQSIKRYWRFKHPKDYMNLEKGFIQGQSQLEKSDLIFEFLLNALRLADGVSLASMTKHTGLTLNDLQPMLTHCIQKGWLQPSETMLKTTRMGYQFLDDVLSQFL